MKKERMLFRKMLFCMIFASMLLVSCCAVYAATCSQLYSGSGPWIINQSFNCSNEVINLLGPIFIRDDSSGPALNFSLSSIARYSLKLNESTIIPNTPDMDKATPVKYTQDWVTGSLDEFYITMNETENMLQFYIGNPINNTYIYYFDLDTNISTGCQSGGPQTCPPEARGADLSAQYQQPGGPWNGGTGIFMWNSTSGKFFGPIPAGATAFPGTDAQLQMNFTVYYGKNKDNGDCEVVVDINNTWANKNVIFLTPAKIYYTTFLNSPLPLVSAVGRLNLTNVTLYINHDNLKVGEGGFLTVQDSVITFNLTGNGTANFTISQGSYVNISNSIIKSNDSQFFWGFYVGSSTFNITNNTISNNGVDAPVTGMPQYKINNFFTGMGGNIIDNLYTNCNKATQKGCIFLAGASNINISRNRFMDAVTDGFDETVSTNNIYVSDNFFNSSMSSAPSSTFLNNTFAVTFRITDKSFGSKYINNNFSDGINDLNATAPEQFDIFTFSNQFGVIQLRAINATVLGPLSSSAPIIIHNQKLGLLDLSSAVNLNVTANLTFYNAVFASQPWLMKNGVRCDDNSNLCNITSYQNNILNATVNGFSNYTLQEVIGLAIANRTVNKTQDSASIIFGTTAVANATLNYGISAALGTYIRNSTLSVVHRFDLSSLSMGTPYYYNLTVCPSEGSCVTNGPYTFTTNTYGQSTKKCSDLSFNGMASCLNNSDVIECAWKSAGISGCPVGSPGCCEPATCNNYHGNKSACQSATSLSCTWSSNQYNENSWCSLSSTNLYRSDGVKVSGVNIGCCQAPACSAKDGTSQTLCESTTFIAGICQWTTKNTDPACYNNVGCCEMPFCDEVTTQTDCNYLSSLGTSCVWANNLCNDPGYGGLSGPTTCIQSGGYWNGTACIPNVGGGGGSSLNNAVRCWFADYNAEVCTNITGCLVCNSNNTHVPSSTCEGKTSGVCAGHENLYGRLEQLPTDSLACEDIRIKSACDCGPVSGCHWANSSATTGSYCLAGVSQCNINYNNLGYQKCTDANTSVQCNALKTSYLLPCRFNVSGTGKCEFDWQSGGGFGDTQGSQNLKYEQINSEQSCKFAGGTWKSAIKDAYGNANTWCEFSYGSTTQSCNSSCWACEFNSGQQWATLALARGACENSSAAGSGCTFKSLGGTQDSSGRWGWCDFPSEMKYFGGGNCNNNCFECFNANMCGNSTSGCRWVTDPMGYGGWCAPAAVAGANTCNSTNALPCQTQALCQSNGHNWTNAYVTDAFSGLSVWLCIANGTHPEICNMPGDEDADTKSDCVDSDCAKDPMCGYGAGMTGENTGYGGSVSGGVMIPPELKYSLCNAYSDVNQSICEAKIVSQNFVFNGTHRGNSSLTLPTHLNDTQICYWHAAPSGSGKSYWCDSLAEQQMKGSLDLSKPPVSIGNDPSGDASGLNYLDIRSVGIANAPTTLNIGISVVNLSSSASCYVQKGGMSNGTYYRYLDVDNNVSTGCTATNGGYDGFDYKLIVKSYYNGSTGLTITGAYKCLNSTSKVWVPTSGTLTLVGDGCYATPSSSGPEAGTFNGVNVLMFTKSDFGIGSKTMRLLVATSGPSANETQVTDQAGPFYYTPNSIDFKKEDCFGFVDSDGDGYLPSQDDDCKYVNNMGYIPSENCFDSIDNNGDSLTDCQDPLCAKKPICGGSMSFTASGTDTTAPQIVFNVVNAFKDSAFVKYDTNEPANGTLYFYYNDSTCYDLNKTINDIGDPLCSGSWCSFDDYKLWHIAYLDNYSNNYYRLGYPLVNQTTYYFKYKVCDPSSNCAVSACMNFTTKVSASSFSFGMTAPTGFRVKTPWATNGQNYSSTVNATDTKNINITIDCDTSGYSLKLVGVSINSAKSMDISSMVCNASNNLLGMNTSVWDQIMFDLNPELVEISWQVSSASNKVYHCDVDGVTNCVDVTSYLSCVQSGTTLTCKVPTTLGFSSYKVTASTPSGGNTPAGGGGGSKKTTTETATIAEEPAQQEASLDEVLAKWAKEETGQETSGTGAEEEPAAVAESQITEEQLVTEGNEIVSEEAPAEEQDLAGAATGITSVVFSSEKAKSIAGLGVIIIILGMLLYMVKRTEGKS